MRLSQKCRLVEGARRAAIYDLESGNVYSLNETARDIVAGRIRNDQFWNELVGMGLADEGNEEETFAVDDAIPKPGLNFMWLELTDECNLRCVHCYASGESRAESQGLGVVVWKRVMREAADLGCERLQLTGGEAFRYKGLLELAAFAKKMGYTFVEIFTNATLLTSEKVRVMKELGFHVAVSLYSSEPSIHDQVTQTPGSFKKTYRGLQLLREFGVPTRIAVVVMKQNESTVAQTQCFVRNLGIKHEKIDVIRPAGRGCVLDLLPTEGTVTKWGLITKPDFRTSKGRFALYHHWNSCWAGKITVTSSGDVLPCVFAREHVAGNILQSSLERVVFGENLQRLWRITKDDVEVCRDCEYRYACKDCRPLAEAETGSLRSKFPRCIYSPYTGIWGIKSE